MDLNTVWFVLIAVLFVGFFFLEGFDYGVGILLPVLGRTDRERRTIINAIGPFWDANEVWLMLAALIVRGAAFEFRSKHDAPRWRAVWDGLIFFGSLIPALLWGVALGNLLLGVPIDASMTYTGGVFNLLNPYALAWGLTTLIVFTLQGAIFLSLKTDGELAEAARGLAQRVWPAAVVIGALSVGLGYFVTDMFARLGVDPGVVPLGAGAAMLVTGWFIRDRHMGWAFGMVGLSIVLSTVTMFIGLFPRVMVSSLGEAYSLTIYNAASSAYTLKIMTWVSVGLLPFVIFYQGWSYYTFRHRLTAGSPLEY
jgi:cytochrome d ubiquinol oxidase subunit II